MKILIVKTSSMGDILHTLPAITDAIRANSNIQFDWLIEEGFAEIPQWHPHVKNIIPVAIRKWRKNFWQALKTGALIKLIKKLRTENYDLIIDAQGLFKSKLLCLFLTGEKCGLDRKSVREGWLNWIYHKTVTVNFHQHAVIRMRELFAKILNYDFSSYDLDYGIDKNKFVKLSEKIKSMKNFILLIHGTTWNTKLWPENYWSDLAKIIIQHGHIPILTFGNEIEKERAERIAKSSQAVVLTKMPLAEIAALLLQAKAVVAVDTGLAHLAAALAIPTISIYGATNAKLTGTYGKQQIHLQTPFPCSPCLQKTCTYTQTSTAKPACYETIKSDLVWQHIETLMNKATSCN